MTINLGSSLIDADTFDMEDVTPQVTARAVEEPENDRATIGDNGAPLTPEEMKKEFNRDIAKLGEQSGKGSAALPRLGLRVIRAAADGLISTDKPKVGKSDAVLIYERYASNDSKHAEHTSGGMKANAAKLNALIGLGCMTTCDGVEVANRAVAVREDMEAKELKPKPLFAGLVDVARAQLECDTPLTDEAIQAALSKKETDKSVEKEWAAIAKKIEGLVTGENPAGLRDASDGALAISKLVDDHIKQFKNQADDREMVEGLMERGHSRAAAEDTVRPGAELGWSRS